jgi:hypothetical protein
MDLEGLGRQGYSEEGYCDIKLPILIEQGFIKRYLKTNSNSLIRVRNIAKKAKSFSQTYNSQNNETLR